MKRKLILVWIFFIFSQPLLSQEKKISIEATFRFNSQTLAHGTVEVRRNDATVFSGRTRFGKVATELFWFPGDVFIVNFKERGTGRTISMKFPIANFVFIAPDRIVLTIFFRPDLSGVERIEFQNILEFPAPQDPAFATTVYRINAGGPDYTDSQGQLWSADQGFNTGNTASVTNSIAGTEDDTLFQSERWDPVAEPELIYSLPVTNGNYRVNLYFAEIYNECFSVGCRVFDVLIEGQLVLNDLDIFQEAGSLTALIKTFDVIVEDGVLNIEFRHVRENPKISALEVLR